MGERRPRGSILGALRAAVAYAAGEALGAFRRNGLMSAAAVTIIMATLLPVGVAVVFAANLRLMASLLERQVQVVAYLREGLTPEGRDRVLAAIQALPGVRRVEFVGRDQALLRLQEALGESISLQDVVETNPLPDSLEITLEDPRAARTIAAAVRQVGAVEDVTFGARAVDRLLAVTALLRAGGAAAALLLGAVALVIIMNTIRLTILGRRQEIEIMQLVGASAWYVRSPFLLEGVVQGLAATVLAALLLTPGYLFLLTRAREVLPFLPLVPPADLLPALVAALAAGGMLVGMGGSLLALRRFLHA
jgi:cell division transport system permease protein